MIHYVIEKKVATHGIKISRGVELVLVTEKKNIVLPKAKPTIVEGVFMAVKVRYCEPIFNKKNGSIVKGVPRDWNKGIQSVNRVSRENFQCCTYCHQIGHQINECLFIEDNVRQRFAEHF